MGLSGCPAALGELVQPDCMHCTTFSACCACCAPCAAQDSGAYFLHLLWSLHSLPGYGRHALLAEPVVFEAASLLVHVWSLEQHHEQRSRYRYSELPRGGLGPPVNYTGARAGREGGSWSRGGGAAQSAATWAGLSCSRRCLSRAPHPHMCLRSWSGYRPSDDPQTCGYNVPVNM